MTLQCTNCPGATDHSTANCPIRPELYADSAQARTGTELRTGGYQEKTFDWHAAQQRREIEATNMRVRVLAAVGMIEMKLGMAGKGCPPCRPN